MSAANSPFFASDTCVLTPKPPPRIQPKRMTLTQTERKKAIPVRNRINICSTASPDSRAAPLRRRKTSALTLPEGGEGGANSTKTRASGFTRALHKRLALRHVYEPLFAESASPAGRAVLTHPWSALQKLGGAVVNDAPLESFMQPLSLNLSAAKLSAFDLTGTWCRASWASSAESVAAHETASHVDSAGDLTQRDVLSATERQIQEVSGLCDGEMLLCSLAEDKSETRGVMPSSVENTSFAAAVLAECSEKGNESDGVPAKTTTSVIPVWRRFATATSLYLSLCAAQVCGASLPFVCVYRCDADAVKLLERVRLTVGSAATETTEVEEIQNDEQVPLAVAVPTATKGTLSDETSGALVVDVEPFSDAEVFQLFFLQLMLRAFFDMRFPNMSYFREGEGAGEIDRKLLRADSLGVHSSGRQPLAYRHPTFEDEWLMFPPDSGVLCILDMKNAVVPLFAAPDQVSETAALPLFGSARGDVPAKGKLGRLVLRWARTQRIESPRDAYGALLTLFELFSGSYGCGKSSVLAAPVPPKVFYSDEETVWGSLTVHSAPLSLFFVQPEQRARAAVCSLGHDAVSAAAAAAEAEGTEESQGVKNFSFAIPAPPPLADVNHSPPSTAAGAVNHTPDEGAGDDLKASFSVIAPSPAPKRAEVKDASVSSASLAKPASAQEDSAETPLFALIPQTSTFTKQENLVTRWRHYALEGLLTRFDGLTDGIEVFEKAGEGGSGIVYRGEYGRDRLPVAVKMFIIPDGMSHESYVRESLTDVAFFVLLNQLDDFGICGVCRAHDFIVNTKPPKGIPKEDADRARRYADSETTKLCFLVTDLMDGVMGRFLTRDDSDFDSFYDTLVCSPMQETELFQFLFFQLAAKSLFDWRVLDVMLHGQLRGDNIGFRYAIQQEEETAGTRARRNYEGILIAYHFDADEDVRYLRFPSRIGDSAILRFIYFIDLGQGMQPNVQELSRNKFIGQTLVDSCIQDDGFGRYWPLDELYCKYVDVKGELAQSVVEWGSGVRLHSQEDAAAAIKELFELYAPTYGVETPSTEDVKSHLCLCWSPLAVAELKKVYVYRVE